MDSYHIPPPAGTHVSLSDVPLGNLYPFFMQWQVPVATATIYTALAFFFNTKMPRSAASKRPLNPPSRLTAMNCAIFVHNAILAIYSGWAFYTVFPHFARNVAQKGLCDGLCDVDGTMWNSVLFVQNYLFYLSKYYELVDTLVLFLKGRTASLLQIYHHAGIIVVMYYSNYYAPAVTVFMVWENAGVHTVMYTYYALTAIKINVPGKKYLTTLQIVQFLFGQSSVLLYFVLPNCQTADQRKWMWILTAYLLPLIYLFTRFFAKTYKKDQPRIKKD
ncbi:hypothetical protein IWW36_004218 [Coemansia brasiliensis]|uniref:Elongation of fatty acids protein n=1 Tax=Coemansia brasiliensis TaxID=2650707 RepID=A0A9W8I3V2_9FUNG|nr:hypothetical protein IWW36_004218 [Coemansia brasiliensis]